MIWTEERLAILRECYERGETWGEAGVKLDVSAKAAGDAARRRLGIKTGRKRGPRGGVVNDPRPPRPYQRPPRGYSDPAMITQCERLMDASPGVLERLMAAAIEAANTRMADVDG